jgi:hypothetical protein
MPKDRLAKLRKVGIWIEHDHAINEEPGPYHPGVDWLTERGYDARLAKKVHVARAASPLERHHMIKHPAVILHELAHAYHDQFLGFDEPRIKAAYEKAMAAGLYDEVLLYTGKNPIAEQTETAEVDNTACNWPDRQLAEVGQSDAVSCFAGLQAVKDTSAAARRPCQELRVPW